ncbi:MAG: RHS repeat protein [Flavobacteriaceae bacterium]|nr:RHS repeat protein [Flavobacteriaceae bacterium]
MKKSILMAAALFATVFASGQSNDLELPKVIPPSPTVAGLMKFEEVPVSNYTGQPNISIPLFQKQTIGGFALPLVMSYNTSGIRIDERSGWLGNGWALSGEAVISRTVMNVADEANYTDNSGNKLKGIYHNGYFDLGWNYLSNGAIDYLSNETDASIQSYLWNASNKGSSKYDGDYDNDLDIYQVSLFGASARFVIIKQGSILVPKMLSNDGNLKVTITYNASFVISKFEVQDTNGLVFVLDQTEQTTSNTATATKTIDDSQNTGSLSFSENTYTSAWKIKEVKNGNSDILATFYYNSVSEEFTAPSSIKENTIQFYTNESTGVMAGILPPFASLFTDTGTNNDRASIISYNNSIALPKWSKSITNLSIATKKISRVVFNDDTEIVYNLSATSHPEYTSGGNLLSSIEMKDAFGNVTKEVEFTYHTTANNKTFLMSYKEIYPQSNELNYSFEYDRKDLLPSFGSIEKDMWGYYKPDESNVNIAYRKTHSSDKAFVSVGVLKKMFYPTGGVKEFIFEPHDFGHLGSRAFTDAEFKRYNPDNWILKSGTDSFNNQSSNNGYSTTTVYFTIDLEQEVSVSSTFISGDSEDANNASIRIENWGNPQQATYINNIAIDREVVFTLPVGSYKMNLFSLSIPGGTVPVLNVDAGIYYKEHQSNFDKLIHGGGVRIKNIQFLDSDTATIPSKQINFAYKATGNETIPNSNPLESSGVIDGFFTNVKEYSYTKNHVLALEGPGNGQTNVLTTNGMDIRTTYQVKEHLNSVYNTMTSGTNVGYDRTIVSQTGNGSSVFEYTSPSDFPTYGANYGYPFLPEKSRAHMHGALTKQKTYNSVDTLLNETTLTYHPEVEIDKATSLFIYDQDCADIQFYGRMSDYIAHFPTNGKEFMGDAQGADPGGYQNCITTNNTAPVYYNFYEHVFGKYLLKEKNTKEYFVENGVALQKEQTENYEYNSNYLPSQTTVTKSNGEEIVSNTYYATDVLPTFTGASGSFTLSDASYSNLNTQNKITTPVVSHTYNKVGSTLELLSTVRNIFTTDNLALPKKVQTYKGDLTLFTSLEDRIIYHDYYANGNVQEVSKVDGTHVVYIWGYHQSVPIAKIENATYSQVSSYVANLQTLSDADNDRTQGSVGNEGLLRTALNNLRAALPDAMVTTITYDSAIGTTSMTDPRGNVIYYEYDNFNRLVFVKDKDGNIVSENQYHYKN